MLHKNKLRIIEIFFEEPSRNFQIREISRLSNIAVTSAKKYLDELLKEKLLTKDKDIVIPGEELAQGLDYLPGPGTYRDGDAIVASRLGLVNIEGRAIKVIPLVGKYNPEAGDLVIGKIIIFSPASR